MGAGQSRAAWTMYAVVGVAAWMGITVYVGAVNDPADPGPVRAAFVAGGALFSVGLLSFHLRAHRAAGKRVNDAIYHKLALTPVSDTDLRAAMRGTRPVGYVYLLASTVIIALVLTAIGLGPDGPSRELAYAALGVAAVTGVYLLRALGNAYRAGDEWLRPLGLRLSETPGWIPNLGPSSGGIILIGDMVYSGHRHGREVAIFQDSRSALTAIKGSFRERTIEDPEALAALAGEAGPWRRVRVESGPDGLTVLRRGNGAGAHMLQDLWLAERAASTNPERGEQG